MHAHETAPARAPAPARATSHRVRFPSYFTRWDQPFFDEILFHYKAYNGRTQADVRRHLHMLYAEDKTQWSRCTQVVNTIARLLPKRPVNKNQMIEQRKNCFLESAGRIRQNNVSIDKNDSSLFDDLRNKILVHAVPEGLGFLDLINESNLQISKETVLRASKLRITVSSHVRHVVAEAIKRGLICNVVSILPQCVVEISGPLSVIRKTRVYGRSFLALLPIVARARRFQILAFDFDNRLSPVLLQNGDPLPLETVPSRFDSFLEERFAADIAVLLPGWKVEREPVPLRIGDKWMFPDFLICPPDGGEHWIVELMGYTTTEYILHKKEQMRAALPKNFLFLISSKLAKHFREFEATHKIVYFKNFVSVDAIIGLLKNDVYGKIPSS